MPETVHCRVSEGANMTELVHDMLGLRRSTVRGVMLLLKELRSVKEASVCAKWVSKGGE